MASDPCSNFASVNGCPSSTRSESPTTFALWLRYTRPMASSYPPVTKEIGMELDVGSKVGEGAGRQLLISQPGCSAASYAPPVDVAPLPSTASFSRPDRVTFVGLEPEEVTSVKAAAMSGSFTSQEDGDRVRIEAGYMMVERVTSASTKVDIHGESRSGCCIGSSYAYVDGVALT